jgi:hypothetical protein
MRPRHRRLETAASGSPQETQGMSAQDQIIDAVMALALQADAIRTHPLMAWIVMHDNATGSGALVARLVTDAATPYVLLADTLARLHEQLPPGLTRTDRQPTDSPEIVEVWFASDSDRARVSFVPPGRADKETGP